MMLFDTMMRYIISLTLLTVCWLTNYAQNWQGKWITDSGTKDTVNTWIAFRKKITLNEKPSHVLARIAADSKYWLWINGKMVVFEGGLKRGPNPRDTYFDEVDIGPYLRKGNNIIAVQLWYFGKEGFSHKSSGKAGLLINCQAPGIAIISDDGWKTAPMPAYHTAPPPAPNFRLPESSLLYDARLELDGWQHLDFDDAEWRSAAIIGTAGAAPWNKLVKRPIPLWKDFGLRKYSGGYVRRGDTLICRLPYNAQFTPYLKINAPAGQKITIVTDNYLFYNGGDNNIRAEYITKEGVQEFESPGWLNGHQVYYIIPPGVTVQALKYRETGYQTEFTGSFSSSDPFFDRLWQKAARTLYVTMRDTYMDCPDRERAQWTGDAVLEAEEAFYALDTSSHALARKWLYELINWQRPDGSFFAPVPAGNWDKELPDQVLASIGYYGIWNHYMHTGNKQILHDLYPAVRKYLSLWERDGDLVKLRKGEWTWGDWGDNRDMLLIFNLWYYLAVKGSHLMALELGKDSDALAYQGFMHRFKETFNKRFWNNNEYRDPAYTGKTDDRVHALAVIAGVADTTQHAAILQVFKTQEHASPYMEKYVFEAMHQMGYPVDANTRHKKRFSKMVNDDRFSTLFEGWGIGKEGFGGGTVNHAWSGGGLTVLSSWVCGIQPVEPGYKVIRIAPQPGDIDYAAASLISVAGRVATSYRRMPHRFNLKATIPPGSRALITLPPGIYKKITVNGKQTDPAVTIIPVNAGSHVVKTWL